GEKRVQPKPSFPAQGTRVSAVQVWMWERPLVTGGVAQTARRTVEDRRAVLQSPDRWRETTLAGPLDASRVNRPTNSLSRSAVTASSSAWAVISSTCAD